MFTDIIWHIKGYCEVCFMSRVYFLLAQCFWNDALDKHKGELSNRKQQNKLEKIWPKKETPALLRSVLPLVRSAGHIGRIGVFLPSWLSGVQGSNASWSCQTCREPCCTRALQPICRESKEGARLGASALPPASLGIACSNLPGCAGKWEWRRLMCPDKRAMFLLCAACRLPDAQKPLPVPLLTVSATQ